MSGIKKIVVTGPESSGKTTLCRQLATDMNCLWVKEYAREYLLQNGPVYQYDDLTKIAKGQAKKIEESISKSTNILICDTDLLTIKIWSEYKYGKVDPWISNWLTENKPGLYLICKPDIPWKPDPLRENPNNRNELFKLYEDQLLLISTPFVKVSGSESQRLKIAVNAINHLKS